MRTRVLACIQWSNGYNGDICTLWLCEEPDTGIVWAVWWGGCYRWADPAKGVYGAPINFNEIEVQA